MRVVVPRGAGFVGSHLVDKLIFRGDDVIVIDNPSQEGEKNVMHHFGKPRFELIRHDVIEPVLLEMDQIYNWLALPPPFITSVRSCYDEGKRTAETLTTDYHHGAGVDVFIACIFNTYMGLECVEMMGMLSATLLHRQPLTVYGDGKQTRSFQYVSDLVDALVALIESEHVRPFNLGNPGVFTVLELAEVVKETIDSCSTIEFKPNAVDDPHKRKPDISKAKELLNWEPKVPLHEGLPRMVSDFRNRILNEDEGEGNK